MRALPPPPVILTAVSAFERRASAYLLLRPRTAELATSAITRLCAEKAAPRNGRSGYTRRGSGMMFSAAVVPILYIGSLLVRAVERARRLPIVTLSGRGSLPMHRLIH